MNGLRRALALAKRCMQSGFKPARIWQEARALPFVSTDVGLAYAQHR